MTGILPKISRLLIFVSLLATACSIKPTATKSLTPTPPYKPSSTTTDTVYGLTPTYGPTSTSLAPLCINYSGQAYMDESGISGRHPETIYDILTGSFDDGTLKGYRFLVGGKDPSEAEQLRVKSMEPGSHSYGVVRVYFNACFEEDAEINGRYAEKAEADLKINDTSIEGALALLDAKGKYTYLLVPYSRIVGCKGFRMPNGSVLELDPSLTADSRTFLEVNGYRNTATMFQSGDPENGIGVEPSDFRKCNPKY